MKGFVGIKGEINRNLWSTWNSIFIKSHHIQAFKHKHNHEKFWYNPLFDTQYKMVRISSVISGLALAMTVAAVPHKEVEGFEEDAPELYLKYKPFLKVKHGCVPFPAVDKDDGGIR